jgi:ATP-dependent DNA helicase RecG
VAERLAKLGVRQVGDLLCLLPQRYEDRTALRALGSLTVGDKVLVEGVIELSEIAVRRRRSLLCRLADGTGALTLRSFTTRAQQQSLVRGARLRCFGEVRSGPAGLEMVHPEHRVVRADEPEPTAQLTPVYPTTEGLHQQTLRRLIEQALAHLTREPLTDYLAEPLRARALGDQPWPTLAAALAYLHAPPRDAATEALLAGRHPCSRRIALEELIAQRLSLRQSAAAVRSERAYPLPEPAAALEEFRGGLPFALTAAQQGAVSEILTDLGASAPMNRLLQGDVGSGKTVVAAMAAVVAAAAHCQTAVMAPTELLAEQHFASFERWLAPLGIAVTPLIGSQPARTRAATLASIADGRAAVVVGTHALFQESVAFHRLALVIVDEQHRFGVQQRLALKQKGAHESRVPHQLIMTATPIPRTLAMTAYADLDCSVIGELPPGRQPVKTVVLAEQRRGDLIERVAAHCTTGQQAYWVCPLIEESELVDSRAASARGARGRATGAHRTDPRPRSRPRRTRDARVQGRGARSLGRHHRHRVGVDVPNATLMVVETAERMGLAQLHQLRGRFGRGHQASTCVLLYQPPLSALARERLQVLRSTNDGFEVAQKDLQLRGPGEVLGTRQTGVMQLRVADLLRDADLLPTVIEVSEQLLRERPECVAPLIRRWVRGAAEYAKV